MDETARATLFDQARSNLASNPAHTHAPLSATSSLSSRVSPDRETLTELLAQEPMIDAIARQAHELAVGRLRSNLKGLNLSAQLCRNVELVYPRYTVTRLNLF
jgi:hypothetical protein